MDQNQPESNRESRLIITKMILENFKSYAGSQEIGPFHKRFSSIVGPNGSGKSNVIDALLFVFGKRAKQLRLNKVSELIHKSSNHPNLEYATVSIHFEEIYDNEADDDEYETVPQSEFIITRTAYKNNQSKYFINSKTSTFTEVGLLLRKHGVDLDNNRFLILQGEVEQIAMMKPKGATPHEEGLLEYLEDIIGSNRYIEKIEEQSKKLDEITEQRVEKVNRLKVAEKERDNLSGAKLEAEGLLEKEKEIRETKNILYHALHHSSAEKAKFCTEKYENSKEKLKNNNEKLTEAQARLKEVSKEYEIVKSEYSKVENDLKNARLEHDSFERKDVKLTEDLKHNQGLLKKQQNLASKEEKKQVELENQVNELEIQIGKYQDLIVDFEERKSQEEANLEQIMTSLKGESQEIRGTLEVAQGNLAAAEKIVSSLKTEEENIKTALNLTKSRSEHAKENYVKLDEKLQKNQENSNLLREKLSELESNGEENLNSEIKVVESEITKLSKEEEKLQNQLRTFHQQVESSKAQLEQQKQSKAGRNPAINAILEAAKPNKKSGTKQGFLANIGIRGRLGDLGAIPGEFDVAVSTAAGGLLDFVVVDNAVGAQKCVDFLRDHNLGRASFIVLEQMKEWENKMNKPIQLPGSAVRLFDCVEILNKTKDLDILPAFYMALKNTLVVENLDMAVKIAYGDKSGRSIWRVVTKEGELIDTSGAMSGGGKSNRSGAMQLLSASTSSRKTSSSSSTEEDGVSEEDVKKMENDVVAVQQNLSECRQLKAQKEKELNILKKKFGSLTTEIEKLKMELKRSEEIDTDLQNRLMVLNQEMELTTEELVLIQEKEASLVEIENKINLAAPDLKTHQNAVSSLQRQILSMGGPKLSKCQSAIDSLSNQLETFARTLGTKQAELSTNMKNVVKTKTAADKANKEIKKIKDKIIELESEQKEMENDASSIAEAVEKTKQILFNLESKLSNQSEEYSSLKEIVAQVRAVDVDLSVEVEKLEKEKTENASAAKHWLKEIQAVHKQHISEQRELHSVIKSVEIPQKPENPLIDSNKTQDENDMDVVEETVSSVEHEIVLLLEYSLEQMKEEGQLEKASIEKLKRELNLLEAEKDRLKGSVNMGAILDYLKKDAAYKGRLYELEEITAARQILRKVYEDLRRERLDCFMSGFGIISLKLKEMYQMLTLGGDAELELLDSLDPFAEGIVFSVRPPRKSWKNISNLSGGEKTLSSLALVFALHHFKPTPLYVMDEIDAALDFKNVSIVANYIKDRTKNAQFAIISLRNNMFELADRLVGIYKTHDATKSVTINPKLFENPVESKKATESAVRNDKKPLQDSTNKIMA